MKISAFFSLVRSGNLLIILLTQVCAYYFLSPGISLMQLFSTSFLMLLACTVMIAAGGYIINDYMDVKLDLVNKPDKVAAGNEISRRWAMFLHLGLSLLAFYLAWRINLKVLLMAGRMRAGLI